MASARKCSIPEQIQTRTTRGQVFRLEFPPFAEWFAVGDFFGPAGLQKAHALFGIGQINPRLGDVRVLQEVGMKLGGRFGDKQDADIQLGHFRSGGPFKERDEVHPFLDGRPRFFAGRDQLFREIDDQRDAVPFFFLFGNTKEKAAEQGCEPHEFSRRTHLMKIGILNVIVDFEPLEKVLLHFGGAESQAVANIVEKQEERSGKRRRARKISEERR